MKNGRKWRHFRVQTLNIFSKLSRKPNYLIWISYFLSSSWWLWPDFISLILLIKTDFSRHNFSIGSKYLLFLYHGFHPASLISRTFIVYNTDKINRNIYRTKTIPKMNSAQGTIGRKNLQQRKKYFSQTHDHMFKILIIGDSGIGKVS